MQTGLSLIQSCLKLYLPGISIKGMSYLLFHLVKNVFHIWNCKIFLLNIVFLTIIFIYVLCHSITFQIFIQPLLYIRHCFWSGAWAGFKKDKFSRTIKTIYTIQEKHNGVKAVFVIFFHISLIFPASLEIALLTFLTAQMEPSKWPRLSVNY